MQASIYIGLMSGTSLDSIDAVAVRFEPTFELIASHSEAIPAAIDRRIRSMLSPGENEIERLGLLDLELGELFAQAALNLIEKHNLNKDEIAAIGSHGQTIRHRPEANFTLQIGDANLIAERTGITTVADFRRRDMAAGGQGAPLVPAFHNALFRSQEHNRILVNIGGMANLTILEAGRHTAVRGYDTGPGNVLMDSWIQQHKNSSYDKDGQWAARGKTNSTLLKNMLELPFFQETPPKSTGREQFNSLWIRQMLNKQDNPPPPVDVQATLLDLTATSIADAINSHHLNNLQIYLCGGGSHNSRLKSQLSFLLKPHYLSTTAELGLDPDWVEAAAFAWLAQRTLNQKSGNIPEVTGASGYRPLGAIYWGN
ncbi:anhydro-N-acetylmuramic acid kinase [Amphritea balenae]|uniref:Anhydro-N-acetylmuramic acid kinase n=1 Tax=Amphritea balenae TaxID=452629 RepID=A0A3P1SIX4_9GAMM|nr:anhydro-N-acetylmuramic acid kinase [Amphritea balenae]RRC96974.1 anhydro-N-acetylmuramic acid kinase [Amphritea balenae]GGK85201.1 anhydro-N-acetylmuramic acid kinase [Amphritea balenae]